MDLINSEASHIVVLYYPYTESPVYIDILFEDGRILRYPGGTLSTTQGATVDVTDSDKESNTFTTQENESSTTDSLSEDANTSEETTTKERRGEADSYEELSLEDAELYGVQLGDPYGASKLTLKQNGYDDMYYAIWDGFEAYSNALKQLKERYNVPNDMYCDILIQIDGDIELILVFDLETKELVDIIARKRIE